MAFNKALFRSVNRELYEFVQAVNRRERSKARTLRKKINRSQATEEASGSGQRRGVVQRSTEIPDSNDEMGEEVETRDFKKTEAAVVVPRIVVTSPANAAPMANNNTTTVSAPVVRANADVPYWLWLMYWKVKLKQPIRVPKKPRRNSV
jgi:hypothetical protein